MRIVRTQQQAPQPQGTGQLPGPDIPWWMKLGWVIIMVGGVVSLYDRFIGDRR